MAQAHLTCGAVTGWGHENGRLLLLTVGHSEFSVWVGETMGLGPPRNFSILTRVLSRQSLEPDV